MAIVPRYNAQIFEGTEAEFTASTTIWDHNDLLITSDTNVWKIGDGAHKWSELEAVGGEELAELATKVDKAGDTMTAALRIIAPVDGNKLWLAKYAVGTGHTNAPTSIGATSTYLQIGGREYGNNGFGGIGFSYVADPSQHPAIWIGWEEKDTAGNTSGDFIVATRPNTTNVAPTERLRITAAGEITALLGAKFVGDGSGLTDLAADAIPEIAQSKVTGLDTALNAKLTATITQFNAKLTASPAAAQADSTATDIAGLVADFNSLLAKLRTAGILAT